MVDKTSIAGCVCARAALKCEPIRPTTEKAILIDIRFFVPRSPLLWTFPMRYGGPFVLMWSFELAFPPPLLAAPKTELMPQFLALNVASAGSTRHGWRPEAKGVIKAHVHAWIEKGLKDVVHITCRDSGGGPFLFRIQRSPRASRCMAILLRIWKRGSGRGQEEVGSVLLFLRCGAVVLYSRVATWRKGPKTSEVWGFEEGERFMCAAKNDDTNTQPEKAGPNAKTGAYKQEMCPGNALNTGCALRRFFEHPVLAYWHLY